ncbi:MAG: response regulator transcription factor [Magnetococcales bacterium]|nr:response regulator transcription factor [Magnetococcales bacterium]
MNVLIIDDDTVVCNLLEEILRYEGHRTVVTRDGPSGLHEFQTREIELVLVDVAIGFTMDGCDVARRIKQLTMNHHRFVPIVLLTAMTDDIQLADCMDQGGDDLIMKPFNRNLLEAKLRAWERVINRFEMQRIELQQSHDMQQDSTATLLSSEEMAALRSHG